MHFLTLELSLHASSQVPFDLNTGTRKSINEKSQAKRIMSTLVYSQGSQSVALLTQAAHPLLKCCRHHKGLQMNTTGVSLVWISLETIVMEFIQAVTDKGRKRNDALEATFWKCLLWSWSVVLNCCSYSLFRPLWLLCGTAEVSTLQFVALQNTPRPSVLSHNW